MDEYDIIRGRSTPSRRPLAAVLFDLFYPMLVAIIIVTTLSSFLDIPIDKMAEDAMRHLLRLLHF